MPAPRPPAPWRSLVLAAVLLALAPSAVAAQEVQDARERVDALRGELEDATARYEDAWAAVEQARTELDGLERREQQLEADAQRLTAELAERARAAYKRGSTATFQSLLSANGTQDAVERAGLLAALQHRQGASLEEAVAIRASLEQARALAESRRRDLAALEAELAADRDALASRFEAAEADFELLADRADRQREIDQGDQQGVYACPMSPAVTHFRNTWGDPRSGGRRHEGTDIFGPMGAEVYAFTSGSIARLSNGGLGGIGVYLQGDDGSLYFYTHLQGYADGLAVGRRVDAGEHIAFNGATGNARGGPPHIHFERLPGGGNEVNPYPWLATACWG